MLTIAVIPLPALTNSSFSGSGSGRANTPSTSLSRTMSLGAISRPRKGETVPVGTTFGVTLIRPSSECGSAVNECARQW